MSNEPAGRKFARETESPLQPFPPRRVVHGHLPRGLARPLRVMKFGGTSVGDSACVRRVIEIIRSASVDGDVVVVVSAMGGVTNKLIEAANRSEAGDREQAIIILEQVWKQHEAAINELIEENADRDRIGRRMRELLEECERWCENTARLGQLTPPMRDAISSLGERLSAPLVAAALAARGVASEALEATGLIVTDEYHGAADPRMDLTRERCQARLRPVLRQGVIPIVTGFIGATVDGVLTTLGRGGSDYSATILASALEANEVTIWTDVDGMLTADPHLVPDASTIPQISYREAAELAHFGAKVLHPKTLRPVMQCGIPVWIRNTFTPERPGTKITPNGHPIDGGVKALTAVSDAALITLGGPVAGSMPAVMDRVLAITEAVRSNVLMVCSCHRRSQICLVVSAASAHPTVEALRREFGANSAQDGGHYVNVDLTVSILTVVGQNLPEVKEIVGRALDELRRRKVNIIATGQGSSDCNASFVVARNDIKVALAATHQEFQLCVPNLLQEARPGAQLHVVNPNPPESVQS